MALWMLLFFMVRYDQMTLGAAKRTRYVGKDIPRKANPVS